MFRLKTQIIFLLAILAISLFAFFLTTFVSGEIVRADLENLKAASSTLVASYDKIRIFDAWNFVKKRNILFSTTTIGLIDTGVDASTTTINGIISSRHPEFEGVNLRGAPNALQDRSLEFRSDLTAGHGTAVAGIIGANNLQIISTTSSQMNGILSGITSQYTLETRSLHLIDPLSTIIKFGSIIDSFPPLSLINMSFAGGKCSVINVKPCIKDSDFNDVTAYFREGIKNHPFDTFIIATGNNGMDVKDFTPANINLPNTIIVGGTDLRDDRAVFSNFGSGVDISAPAVDVYAPVIRGKGNFSTSVEGVTASCPLTNVSLPAAFEKGLCNYKTDFSGTSASAPLVTGVAAIIKSIRPTSTPAEIKDILTRTADPLFVSSTSDEAEKSLGFGCFGVPPAGQVLRGCRLNALKAVQALF